MPCQTGFYLAEGGEKILKYRAKLPQTGLCCGSYGLCPM